MRSKIDKQTCPNKNKKYCHNKNQNIESAIHALFSISNLLTRGGVEDTIFEAKAKDTKNLRPRSNTDFLRTDPLKAKTVVLEAKD